MVATTVVAALALVLSPEVVTAQSKNVLVQRSGTSISYASETSTWVISTPALEVVLGFDSSSRLSIRRLAAKGRDSVLQAGSESALWINGAETRLEDGPSRRVRLVASRNDDYRGGVRLSLVFDGVTDGIRVTRHYVAYADAPSFVETWTEIERLDSVGDVDASVLAPWRVRLATRSLRWLTGLDAPVDDIDRSFTRQARELDAGESFTLWSGGRSTSVGVPLVVAPGPAGTFVGGLMWSGMWSIELSGTPEGTLVDPDMRETTVRVTARRPVESMHGFIGVVGGDEHDVPDALGRLLGALRGGRGFPRLVTYNTWFVHGTKVDASIVDHEIETARALGIELFQLDAGWYVGAGANDVYDFTAGVGGYDVDAQKFPTGLRDVGRRLRSNGMKFGLWAEPERVDRSRVGRAGEAEESWLATVDGAYEPGVSNNENRAAQICLAHPDAWQWVLDKLTALVDQHGVDYLKIDSNFWVNCTRKGHEHGSGDGAYWHVRGLYALLEALRDRFPDLIIENCAGGANRIDFGLGRYTDAAWMDDRTTPSQHVRHNLQGLSWFLPPSYLLSFTMNAPGESMTAAGDAVGMIRSRMPGVLGFAYRFDELSGVDVDLISHQVGVYKRVRDAVGESTYSVVLSRQTVTGAVPEWEVVEQVGRDTGAVAVFAYENAGETDGVRVVLRDLNPTAVYQVYSADRGVIGQQSGADLMDAGLTITAASSTRAQVLILTPVSSVDRARAK